MTTLVRRIQAIKQQDETQDVIDIEREKHYTALKAMKNRIFIAKDLKRRNLFDEWTEGLKIVWQTGDYRTS